MRSDSSTLEPVPGGSAFHHRFHAVTAMSPLQFQKRIRLQEARALLIAGTGDVLQPTATEP
jgi:transcriptional regulator GlxA family with amidase domain